MAALRNASSSVAKISSELFINYMGQIGEGVGVGGHIDIRHNLLTHTTDPGEYLLMSGAN